MDIDRIIEDVEKLSERSSPTDPLMVTGNQLREIITKHSVDPIQTVELSFEQELKFLINRRSKENGSNTPDFVLAQYLLGCLENFDKAVNAREQWYGNDSKHP